ncbi:MAG TPA: radical SAM protein [Vicinamibacterales bacterium]|nr:radical SAM protein [Vicinamibacterales bacterium]
MNRLDYGEFSKALHDRQSGLRLPLSGTIEVTRRCPLVCAHCYNNLPMSDAQAHRAELTLDEHRRLLDELSDAGCLWLLYSGGEIFARPDFLDIYSYAKQKGFLITLFTNGTLVTERIADHLARWRPFAIEITLYGRTKDTYERLTGIPGSFDKCIRGIRLLKERGLPLALKTVAVSINLHELDDMERFATEEIGVHFKSDSAINPRLDCSQSPLAVRISPEEAVAIDLNDQRRGDEWVRFAAHVREALQASPPPDTVYQCGGGINSFAIDPYGRMSICVLSEAHKTDVRAGRFREAWEGFLLEQRSRRTTRPTKCSACALKSACGMCPANAELENGDPETPVDYLCHTAHLRAYALGLEVPPHGDCEYCAGGVHHPALVASAERLQRGVRPTPVAAATDVGDGRRVLPVVSIGAPGGCSSCSAR